MPLQGSGKMNIHVRGGLGKRLKGLGEVHQARPNRKDYDYASTVLLA